MRILDRSSFSREITVDIIADPTVPNMPVGSYM